MTAAGKPTFFLMFLKKSRFVVFSLLINAVLSPDVLYSSASFHSCLQLSASRPQWRPSLSPGPEPLWEWLTQHSSLQATLAKINVRPVGWGIYNCIISPTLITDIINHYQHKEETVDFTGETTNHQWRTWILWTIARRRFLVLNCPGTPSQPLSSRQPKCTSSIDGADERKHLTQMQLIDLHCSASAAGGCVVQCILCVYCREGLYQLRADAFTAGD